MGGAPEGSPSCSSLWSSFPHTSSHSPSLRLYTHFPWNHAGPWGSGSHAAMDAVEVFLKTDLKQMWPLLEVEEFPVSGRVSGRTDRSSLPTLCKGLIHFICLFTMCQPLLEARSAEMGMVLMLSWPFLQHHEQRSVQKRQSTSTYCLDN